MLLTSQPQGPWPPQGHGHSRILHISAVSRPMEMLSVFCTSGASDPAKLHFEDATVHRTCSVFTVRLLLESSSAWPHQLAPPLPCEPRPLTPCSARLLPKLFTARASSWQSGRGWQAAKRAGRLGAQLAQGRQWLILPGWPSGPVPSSLWVRPVNPEPPAGPPTLPCHLLQLSDAPQQPGLAPLHVPCGSQRVSERRSRHPAGHAGTAQPPQRAQLTGLKGW